MNPLDLAQALDDLNVMGALESLIRRDKFTWGPKPVKCRDPLAAGALVWRRGSGYHGYKTLTLIGVWAMSGVKDKDDEDDEDVIHIVIGVKYAAYNAPFFDAEAYHTIIKRDFVTYYDVDGAPPPPENQRAAFVYDRAQRLEQRKQVIAALRACIE